MSLWESWEAWGAAPKLLVTLLVLALATFLLRRRKKPAKKVFTPAPEEVAEKVAAFEPIPLCPEITEEAKLILSHPIVLEGAAGKYARVHGFDAPLLNFATMDFLGFGRREEQKETALQTLNKYGCGSCGPRGFYGTIDVHVFLEEELASFFGTEACAVYSDDVSTVQSVIPAFSNKEDLLLVDDACNDTIISGVILSRANVFYFKHNDVEDLERALIEINKMHPKSVQRRFIIIEGIYKNSGDIAPLKEILSLKAKYKWRIFVDESLSMFVLGKTGRGITEHFGLPITSVELNAASMNTTLASIGGFSVGRKIVVDQQKLYGAGYVYSASSPPFVSTAASCTLKLLQQDGPDLLKALAEKAAFFREQLQSKGEGILECLGAKCSPLVHVRLAKACRIFDETAEAEDEKARLEEDSLLEQIAAVAAQKGILVRRSTYIKSNYEGKKFKRPKRPPPSLKVILTAAHTENEIESGVQMLVEAARTTLNSR